MLKYTVLLAAVFCLVSSQRPWHAGSGTRLPVVLPQYIDQRIAEEAAGQAAQAGQPVQPGPAVQPGQASQPGQTVQSNIGIEPSQTFAPDVTVNSRVQPEDTVLPTRGPQEPERTFPTGGYMGFENRVTPTMNLGDFPLPIDAHGDIDLINRIKTWPREKQPFWYINWQAIQAHRGDMNTQAQVQPNTRSFFAG